MKLAKIIVSLALMTLSLMMITHAETNIDKRKTAMKFNNFVYIFLGPGLNSQQNRSVIKTDKLTFTAIGIDFQHKEQVIDIAKEAIANGAQIIELCGGFGPLWIARVTEAINGQVPVGSVAYGPEARKPLVDLMS